MDYTQNRNELYNEHALMFEHCRQARLFKSWNFPAQKRKKAKKNSTREAYLYK